MIPTRIVVNIGGSTTELVFAQKEGVEVLTRTILGELEKYISPNDSTELVQFLVNNLRTTADMHRYYRLMHRLYPQNDSDGESELISTITGYAEGIRLLLHCLKNLITDNELYLLCASYYNVAPFLKVLLPELATLPAEEQERKDFDYGAPTNLRPVSDNSDNNGEDNPSEG